MNGANLTLTMGSGASSAILRMVVGNVSVKGADGKSAYELYKEANPSYTGDLNHYLTVVMKGATGADGKSAFVQYVEQTGYTGTLAEFNTAIGCVTEIDIFGGNTNKFLNEKGKFIEVVSLAPPAALAISCDKPNVQGVGTNIVMIANKTGGVWSVDNHDCNLTPDSSESNICTAYFNTYGSATVTYSIEGGESASISISCAERTVSVFPLTQWKADNANPSDFSAKSFEYSDFSSVDFNSATFQTAVNLTSVNFDHCKGFGRMGLCSFESTAFTNCDMTGFRLTDAAAGNMGNIGSSAGNKCLFTIGDSSTLDIPILLDVSATYDSQAHDEALLNRFVGLTESGTNIFEWVTAYAEDANADYLYIGGTRYSYSSAAKWHV